MTLRDSVSTNAFQRDPYILPSHPDECAGPPHAACNINPAEPTFIRESIEVRLVAIERTD